MIRLKLLSDLDVKNRIVLLRVDLNLPRKDGKVKDNTRITRVVATINYLIFQNAKIVIISHIGRPKGKLDPELSLEPIIVELEKCLDRKVKFCRECVGPVAKNAINNMQFGDIILLENLRFHPGEELNDINFINQLANLGNVYINDTFSCSHRKHASIYGIAEKLPSAAGFLLWNELSSITSFLNDNNKPFTVIIGGAKISTKLSLLNKLVERVDYLIIAGAMANTFLAAKGLNIGCSLYEPSLTEAALHILQKSLTTNCQIILPFDVVTISNFNQIKGKKKPQLVPVQEVRLSDKIMDIGSKTLNYIAKIIERSRVLAWNGPVGVFEQIPFDYGSNYLAKLIAQETSKQRLCSVIGGGDTISAIRPTGLINSFSYVSTGGGAFLAWLENKTLPGIEVLRDEK